MSDKPTDGPWKYYRGEVCYRSYEDDQAFGMWCPVNFSDEATGQLAAEAGTVYHETGLTPRELADERERLREALLLALPELNGLALASPCAKSLADRARAALSAERKT